jgi:hypothetical protein
MHSSMREPSEYGYEREPYLIGRLKRRVLFSYKLTWLVLGLSAKKMMMQELIMPRRAHTLKRLFKLRCPHIRRTSDLHTLFLATDHDGSNQRRSTRWLKVCGPRWRTICLDRARVRSRSISSRTTSLRARSVAASRSVLFRKSR